LGRYVPVWLPADEHAAFIDRLTVALERYERTHGWHALADPLMRGRVIGGVASAFRARRLSSAWGRTMLSMRGNRARRRAIALRGEQWHEHYAAIGRLGAAASVAARRERARFAAMAPHVREHATRVLGRTSGRMGRPIMP